jgi:hypothetical protein
MSRGGPTDLPVTINLESENYKPDDSEWQQECHQLYSQIRDTLDTGTIEPLKVSKGGKGYRGGFVEIFSTVTAGIASIGGLSVIIDLAKLWLEHRKGSEITLKFPDGSEMKVSRASKEDILKLYERQLAQQRK